MSIAASLPALGEVNITLHDEAAKLLSVLGTGELDRLSRVQHLGVVSSVFLGAQHSRLEYMWQQCAMVEMLRRLHKDNPEIALSSRVMLTSGTQVSSAEVLLKCWIILGHYGRPKFTHATEGVIASLARQNKEFRRALLSTRIPADIRRWSNKRIRAGHTGQFQYILAICRLLATHRRTTSGVRLYLDMLRDLLLPIDDLRFTNANQRAKIDRLRRTFDKIRLVCMVAIDSYYSHQPLRLQLVNALSGFDNVAGSRDRSGMSGALAAVAGLLADELYLHPRAVAVQCQYQREYFERLRDNYKTSKTQAPRSFSVLLDEVMEKGLGDPRPDRLKPLFRLAFESSRPGLEGLQGREVALERLIAGGRTVFTAVRKNEFSDEVYVDCFRQSSTPSAEVARTFWRSAKWLIEAAAGELAGYDRFVTPGDKSRLSRRLAELVAQLVQQQVGTLIGPMRALFWGALDYIVPVGNVISVQPHNISEYDYSPVQANVTVRPGYRYGGLSRETARLLDRSAMDPGRRAEVMLLRTVAERSSAPIVIACVERTCLRDSLNRALVEWDSTVVEIDSQRLRITILEAKKGVGRTSDKAFGQLANSVSELRLRSRLKYERKRLLGGARLTIDILH